jgi:23S rRNA (cytidine1920-2'-O)/16S rRNA (cytidine1409-2'-O)-methyltransferase
LERKLRLDKFLIERGFFTTRSKAQEAIKRGFVMVNGKKINKSGFYVDKDSDIKIIDNLPFVSRGGEKLKEIIERFDIEIENKICIDIGSGTGGFTEVLLKYGAKKVYAVDVGKGILDENLRRDKRVIVKEGLNARYIDENDIPEIVDLIVQDTSFISSKLIISNVKKFLKENGDYIVLIKPQFEVGKENLKYGVVKDFNLHKDVLLSILNFIKIEGFHPIGLIPSPIKGKDGNIEYLIYMIKKEILFDFSFEYIVEKVVKEAEEKFYEDRNFIQRNR